MTELSIIIVNYNVKHFVEQCLTSVYKAIKNVNAEVLVVDNNSVDGSCTMIRKQFSGVNLIENKKNHGFSYANNQAIEQSKGKYILLLNPDTIVEEDSFTKCIQFMDTHPDAGGISVKMIDGKGQFLRESKRALPTPKVSFYKIFGLTKLFPRSKQFGKYYLGHLNNDKASEIEILPGAYMFLRKETLNKTGLFDEDFFMYGEDIDLSYRIIKAGYKNYYFPDTTIIHYKGESTKKGTLNYVFMFYNAMIIFARKHFSSKTTKIFSLTINIAIYFRALFAIFSRFAKKIFLPLFDSILIYTSYYFVEPIWENYKFEGKGQYPKEFLQYVVPAYILIWILSIWLNAGYSKNMKILNLIKGVTIGSIIILIFYALLPESLRFSRALILIGSVSALIATIIVRLIGHLIQFLPHKFKAGKKLKIAIIGLKEETERVKKILFDLRIKPIFIGNIAPSDKSQSVYHIANINQLNEIVKIHKIDEIVFCAKDTPSNQIINTMFQLSGFDISFKIARPESLSIIGSNSIETAGELYSIKNNSILKEKNIRYKRIFDVVTSSFILMISPLILIFSRISIKLINNSVNVLLGCKTWVGYSNLSNVNIDQLPKIKEGILTPLVLVSKKEYSESFITKSNIVYAKNYTILNDVKILLKGFKQIGR